MNINYIVTPLLGSIIGYTTNWLAIKMLFKPHRAYHIGKIKVPFTPGLIPRERDRIAKSLGEAVGGKLLTEHVILKELTHPKVIESLKEYVVNDLLDKEISVDGAIKIVFPETEEFYKKMGMLIQQSLVQYIQTDKKLQQELYETVSKLFGYEKAVSDLLGSKIDTEINRLLMENKVLLAHQVCVFVGDEAVGDKIKELLGSIISEKIGGLAAMFLQPASIYTMIVDFVNTYFETDEHQVQLIQGIIKLKDKALHLRLSDMISEEYYEDTMSKATAFIEAQMVAFIQSETFINKVSEILQRMAQLPILLTEDMKITLEKVVEEQYLKFATTHLPVFLGQFNVTSIVESEINKFSVDEVENLIFKIVDKELNAITWLGGLLGLIMGLITLLF